MEFCCFVFTFFEKRCNKQRKHARDHSQVLTVTVRAPVLLVSRSAPCLLSLLQKVAPGGCINPGLASPNGREVPQGAQRAGEGSRALLVHSLFLYRCKSLAEAGILQQQPLPGRPSALSLQGKR